MNTQKKFKQSSVQARWDHCIEYFRFFRHESGITVDDLKTLHQLLGEVINEKEERP